MLIHHSNLMLLLRSKIIYFISSFSRTCIQLGIYFPHVLFPLGLPWILLYLIAQINIGKRIALYYYASLRRVLQIGQRLSSLISICIRILIFIYNHFFCCFLTVKYPESIERNQNFLFWGFQFFCSEYFLFIFFKSCYLSG